MDNLFVQKKKLLQKIKEIKKEKGALKQQSEVRVSPKEPQEVKKSHYSALKNILFPDSKQ